jgi:hypothetical protein
MTAAENLRLSIRALHVYGIEPAIIQDMLNKLHVATGANRNQLFAAYLQGKRDQVYSQTKWEYFHPIGKYRVKKKFLKWYNRRKA